MTGLPIHALRRNRCRFPITPFGATTHLFCAAVTEEDGATYCAEHAARCYDRRTLAQRKAAQEKAAHARAALGLGPARPKF